MENVKIIEDNSFKSFRMFFMWTIHEKLYSWMISLLAMKLLSPKKTNFFYILKDGEYIGGFTISSLPTLKYKPVNLFNPCFINSARELKEKGYKYFGHFIILGSQRKLGIGSFLFNDFFKNTDNRVWFVPNSKKTESFYLENGAQIYKKCSEVIMIKN